MFVMGPPLLLASALGYPHKRSAIGGRCDSPDRVLRSPMGNCRPGAGRSNPHPRKRDRNCLNATMMCPTLDEQDTDPLTIAAGFLARRRADAARIILRHQRTHHPRF